jgi:hypothetical protein
MFYLIDGFVSTDFWKSRWFEPFVEHGGHWSVFLKKNRWCSPSLLFTLPSHTMFFMLHGNLAEWGPVTAVANSADHHDQSISHGSAHSGTPSCVFWHVGFPVMLEVHLLSCFLSLKSSLIYIRSSITVDNWIHVHMTFLTGNNYKNK